MSTISETPKPPYYAVIFTAIPSENTSGYFEMVAALREEVSKQEGFLGMESAGSDFEITVSYWKDEESIRRWKMDETHKIAQSKGKSDWYSQFQVRICKVERAYGFVKEEPH